MPAGEVWQLEKAFIDGRSRGTSTAAAFHVTLFANDGTVPGVERFATTVTPVSGTPYPDVELPLDGRRSSAPGPGGSRRRPASTPSACSIRSSGSGPTATSRFGSIAGVEEPRRGHPSGHDCLEFTPRTECLLPLPGGAAGDS